MTISGDSSMLTAPALFSVSVIDGLLETMPLCLCIIKVVLWRSVSRREDEVVGDCFRLDFKLYFGLVLLMSLGRLFFHGYKNKNKSLLLQNKTVVYKYTNVCIMLI